MSATDTEVRRLYTLDEANQRLPLVRAIVQDIVYMYRDLIERRERLAEIKRARGQATVTRMHAEELAQVEEDIERDESKLIGFVRELSELGADLKDPRIGLVDFRSLMEGRMVDLCWKLGEDEIQYWHDIDAGFAGRQPVDGCHFSGGMAKFAVAANRR